MSNKKISELVQATQVNDTDELAVVQSGQTKRVTKSVLQDSLSVESGTTINLDSKGTMDNTQVSDFSTGQSATFNDSGSLGGSLGFDASTPIRGKQSLFYTNNATASNSDNDWVSRTLDVPTGYRGRVYEFNLQFVNQFTSNNVVLKLQDSNGKFLVDEGLSKFEDTSNGTAQEFSRQISIDDNVSQVIWGFQIIGGEASKELRIDDVQVTPNIREVLESIVSTKPSSMVRVHGTNGQGSTSGAIRRFTTVQDNIGTAVSYVDSVADGATFTINEDGVYHISYEETNSGGNVDGFGITLNASDLTVQPDNLSRAEVLAIQEAGPSDARRGSCSWSGILSKGDVIRPQNEGTLDETTFASFTITKIGETSVFPALKDQKIEIPTSQLFFPNGGNSKGTGAEANTVTFNTPTIVGDSLSYDSSNGTIVTANKPGVVYFSYNIVSNASANGYVTINSADNIGGTILAFSEFGASGADRQNLAGAIKVKSGDEIRFIMPGATPLGSDGVILVHQEAEVSVAVNNIEPQYEESDSMIRLNTTNGKGATNTAIRRFSNVISNIGSDITYQDDSNLGASFTINKTGTYHISYTDIFGTAARLGISVNSSELSTPIDDINPANTLALALSGSNNWTESVSWSGILSENDVIRPHTNNLSDNTSNSEGHFTISRQANPSVIGIDGQQLEVFTKDPDSLLRLQDGAGFGSTGTHTRYFGSLSNQKGSAFSYIPSSTNGDTVEIFEDGMYHLTYNEVGTASAGSAFGIIKNPSANNSSYISFGPDHILSQAQVALNAERLSTSITIPLEKGDIIAYMVSTPGNFLGADDEIVVTMAKIGELRQIIPLENQKVEVPTSTLNISGLIAKGTGSESLTLQYDNVDEINGEAIAYDNSNGTIITIQKNGILSVSASSDSPGTIYITKNSVDNTAEPQPEEIIASHSPGSGARQNLAGTVEVKVGDKIRVLNNSTLSVDTRSVLRVSHFEKEVEVAINNIEPQYEESDSMIRVGTGNGEGSSSSSVRRFSSLLRQLGEDIIYKDSAVLGASFTVNKAGIYHISYTDSSSQNANHHGITLNSTNLSASVATSIASEVLGISRAENSSADYSEAVSWSGYLNEGDVVRAQTDTSYTTYSYASFTIARQGNPSIVGVDGRELTAFEEQPDSMIRVITPENGNTTVKFGIVAESVGSSITYRSDGGFLANEDGLYHFNGTIYLNAQTNCSVVINSTVYDDDSENNPNVVFVKTLTGGAAEYNHVSFNAQLEAGDVVYINTSGTVTYQNTANNFFEVHKAGKLKNLIPTTDQKVDIPTSQVIMRSCQAKGTGSESSTVQYSDLEKIIGEGLSVNNTNGTIISVEKDGIVHVSANGRATGATVSTIITLNATDPSSFPQPSEVMARQEKDAANSNASCSASFKVSAGDKIRVYLDGTVAGDGHIPLIVTHQEVEVEVAITNIDPQFEESDSSIELYDFKSYGSTNTKIASFTSLSKNIGDSLLYTSSSVDGDSITVQESGVYHVSVNAYSGAQIHFGVTVDSTELTTDLHLLSDFSGRIIYEAASGQTQSSAWSGYLTAGQVLRFHTNAAVATITDRWRFSVSKVGKPSVIGVDGRPTDAFRQEENSFIKVKKADGQGSTDTRIVIFDRIVEMEGGSIKYEVSPEHGSVFTCLEDGTYSFVLNLSDTSNEQEFGISKNADEFGLLSTNLGTIITNTAYDGVIIANTRSGTSSGTSATCVFTGPLKAGDRIRAHMHSVSVNTASQETFMTAFKLGDIHRVSTTVDTTVEIPTSVFKMTGSSSKGSGSENFTVIYDNVQEFSGDAVTVDNTNGTVFTVQKDGVLNISATYRTNINGQQGYITKNASDPSTFPSTNEILASDRSNGTAHTYCMSWEGLVRAGDKIRVACEVAPIAVDYNVVTLSHQVTEVPVSISNINPQFEDAESSIWLSGTGPTDYGSTNISVRRFGAIQQKIGDDVTYIDSSTEGSKFVINKTGLYHMHFTAVFTTAEDMTILRNPSDPTANVPSTTLSESEVIALSESSASGFPSIASCSLILNEGDVVFAAIDGNPSLNTSKSGSQGFKISRAGSPTVTGVDVSSFADGESIERQSLNFFESPGISFSGVGPQPIQFDDVNNIIKEGDLLISPINVGSTTEFRALKECWVHTSMSITVSVTNGSVALRKNGADVSQGWTNGAANNPGGGVGYVKLNKGDYLEFSYRGSNSSPSGDASMNMYAEASSESVISETQDIFDSNVSALVFQSSALSGNEPVGTFTTYDYSASSNNAVLKGSHTQVSSQINIDGFLLNSRAYNQGADTNPARIDVIIGKGHKTVRLDAYQSAGKSDAMSIDMLTPNSTDAYGTQYAYNELSGILTISAGLATTSTETTRRTGTKMSDGSLSTVGYYVVRASRKLPLVNIPSRGIVKFSEKQASGGFSSMSLSTGTFVTNVLNTTQGDEWVATRSGNSFTCQPGKYLFEIEIPVSTNAASSAMRALARLRDTVNNVTLETSSSVVQRASGNDIHTEMMKIVLPITLTQETTMEAQTYVNDTSFGGPIIGRDVTSGESINFTVVKIEKLG